MRRRLFTLLAGASLILWLAVSALWVRSHWVADSIRWEQAQGGVVAKASRGRLWVFQFHITQRTTEALRWERDKPGTIKTARPPWADSYFSTPAFTVRTGRSPAVGMSYWDAIVPFWALATVLAVLPLLWLATRWRQRRRERVEGFRVVVAKGEAGPLAGAPAGDHGRA